MSEAVRVAGARPGRALPARAFVPGRSPRDERPRDVTTTAARVPPERWREDDAWLAGVDLYEHGFAWEAHAAWEARWRAPHDDDQREFVAALVRLAASVTKSAMARTPGADPERVESDRRGASRLARRAHAALARLAPRLPATYMGLDLARLVAATRAWADAAEHAPDARPRLSAA